MKSNLLVFDDFYTNVDSVRQYALGLDFNIAGNYPGLRTLPEPTEQKEYLKSFFEESIINKKITHWPDEYNTSYQMTFKYDDTWVHHDDTEWAGILYLTPTAPVASGTGIYRHKKSGIYEWNSNDPDTDFNGTEDLADTNAWDLIDQVGNIYNRLIVYRGSLYHRSVVPGFGSNKETGRLFQTFFFDTEGENE